MKYDQRNKQHSLKRTEITAKRHKQEKYFIVAGKAVIIGVLTVMFALFIAVFYNSTSAFSQHHIRIPLFFSPTHFASANLREAEYQTILDRGMLSLFPESASLFTQSEVRRLLSPMAEFALADMIKNDTTLIGTRQEVWLLASYDTDMFLKGKSNTMQVESNHRVSDQQIKWITALQQKGRIENRFNWNFFTNSDSRQPEIAGIYGALKGSLLTIIITFVIAFPVGVGTAIYIEEFAPDTRWTRFIKSTINTLSAVPPIVFGLLGTTVFISLLHLQPATPLVAGMVLSLMVLPTIVIASRTAICTVPSSTRNASLELGASQLQTIFHHIIPQALPRIITGTLISMVQAFGECAPLLTIGMVSFVGDIPQTFTEPATTLPVQIYLWAMNSEITFRDKAAAAILVLLIILGIINALALLLRNRFDRKSEQL